MEVLTVRRRARRGPDLPDHVGFVSMRRFWSEGKRFAAILAALVVAVAVGTPSPAFGQGFFESLFGTTPAPQYRPPPVYVPRYDPQRYPVYRNRVPVRPPRNYAPHVPGKSAPAPRRSSRPGRYRTICVRLCDGFYFPISDRVASSRFPADANTCDRRCSSDSKLFYARSGSGSIDDARDLSGRAYEKLKTAFLYRKKKVRNCTCRARPWSDAERARHESYARDAEVRRLKAKQEADARTEAETGVPVSVAVALFQDDLAEALPPAPRDDWQAPDTVAQLRSMGRFRTARLETERMPRTIEIEPRPEAYGPIPPAPAPRVEPAPRVVYRPSRPQGGGSWYSSFSGGGLYWPGD